MLVPAWTLTSRPTILATPPLSRASFVSRSARCKLFLGIPFLYALGILTLVGHGWHAFAHWLFGLGAQR